MAVTINDLGPLGIAYKVWCMLALAAARRIGIASQEYYHSGPNLHASVEVLNVPAQQPNTARRHVLIIVPLEPRH